MINPMVGNTLASSFGNIRGMALLPFCFTIEGFYKKYSNYPVSILDGISLANKGTDFGAVGNEPVQQNGKGRA